MLSVSPNVERRGKGGGPWQGRERERSVIFLPLSPHPGSHQKRSFLSLPPAHLEILELQISIFELFCTELVSPPPLSPLLRHLHLILTPLLSSSSQQVPNSRRSQAREIRSSHSSCHWIRQEARRRCWKASWTSHWSSISRIRKGNFEIDSRKSFNWSWCQIILRQGSNHGQSQALNRSLRSWRN